MCTFGVLGLLCEAPAALGPPGFHTTTREHAHLTARRFKNTTKFPREDAQREKKERKLWREREKKSENLGGSAEGQSGGGRSGRGGKTHKHNTQQGTQQHTQHKTHTTQNTRKTQTHNNNTHSNTHTPMSFFFLSRVQFFILSQCRFFLSRVFVFCPVCRFLFCPECLFFVPFAFFLSRQLFAYFVPFPFFFLSRGVFFCPATAPKPLKTLTFNSPSCGTSPATEIRTILFVAPERVLSLFSGIFGFLMNVVL